MAGSAGGRETRHREGYDVPGAVWRSGWEDIMAVNVSD